MFKKVLASRTLGAGALRALFGFGLVLFIVLGGDVFAEGDTECKGRITGVTPEYNFNSGILSFDSHLGNGAEDYKPVSLSIVGFDSGLAPAERKDAACVEKESGTYGGEVYEYGLRGWAWNTNGGFTSFNCTSGVNDAGESPVSCGDVDYGVYLGSADADGDRKLFGYGWSPTYGWMQFSGQGDPNDTSEQQQMNTGGVVTVTLNGADYTVNLVSVNNGTKKASVKIFDSAGSLIASKLVAKGQTVQFGAVKLMAIDVKTGAGPNLIFTLTTDLPTFDYGVTRDVNGNTLGYAWTQARLYIDFSDLILRLPDESDNTVAEDNWCAGKPFVCAQVDIDNNDNVIVSPADLEFGSDIDVKLADGTDGYYIHLYFRDKDGNDIDPDLNSVFVKGIVFNWEDKVKRDQTSYSVNDTLNQVKNPWTFSGKGAVTFKPLKVSDFSQVLDAGGQKDVGHFISKSIIASFAPTSESKLSPTTSTKPVYYSNNEEFVYDPSTLNDLEENVLVLKSITFPELVDNGDVLLNAGAVYPNGKIDMPFKFKPAVVVDPLYANDLQDKILAYRSIPMNFKMGVKVLSNALANMAGFNDINNANNKVTFTLTYSDEETNAQPDCAGADVKKDFVFKFLDNGATFISDKILTLAGKGEIDVQAMAELPDYDSEDSAQLPCAIAKGANLYTKVAYKVGTKTVYYYDNKLPRIPGSAVLNPVVVVHGNVYGQVVGTVRADERVQTSGVVNMNLIRDAIDENLWKYAEKAAVNSLVGGDCKILKLEDKKNGITSTPECIGTYLAFDVVTGANTEHVLYFKGSDVTFKLSDGKSGGSGKWGGRWVIAADGGNIFVDSNLYDPGDDNARLSLIAFRAQNNADYFKTGNVYVAPCSTDPAKSVTDVQATIVADGSIFSYSGDHAAIDSGDSGSGEPTWAGYNDMIKALNCQLFLKGAISSDNTIGGANLDQGVKPKNYLLSGGGKIIKLPASLNDRMEAQYYDLNYLRMFRLDLELNSAGLPIDQKCGKPWTAEDQKNLIAGQTVCGEKDPCDVNGGAEQPNACNGINPLAKYDAEKSDGDLIVPSDDLLLAKGLNKYTDFEPVYVYYIAPDKDSFVFSKAGAINVGGN